MIANRGEIALRILRACRELGMETVAVYSQADEEALPVQLATQAVCIGPAKASDSYLNQEALLTVAQATGCDGVHPGYGFLSENADFADACAQRGLTFIGPSGDAIRRAGSKSAAKTRMQQAGVPVTPGSQGPVESVEAAQAVAESVGYPVLLKASAGGGGRGIRRVYGPEELPEAFESARAEAVACFGNGEMYLEKLILRHGTLKCRFWQTGMATSSLWETGIVRCSGGIRSFWRRRLPGACLQSCERKWVRRRSGRQKRWAMRMPGRWSFCWTPTASISTLWR